MGLIGLLAVVGIGAFLMSGDSKGDAPPAEVADAPPLGARPAPPDDTDEVPSRSRDKGKKYDIEQLQALKGQIDLSIWSNIESLMAEAMPLYDEALAAREQGREKDFKAKMREALKKWREADGISEDWIYTIDALDDNLWEVLFKKESAKLLRWTKTFRGYTGLENG